MHVAGKKKIVLLGMMANIPVAGVVWQYMHYLIGFQRLGYDVYYVEQHARNPSMFMETENCDGSGRAAAFLDGVMRRFDLGHAWAYQARHENNRWFGLSENETKHLFNSAELIINMHGGTAPLPEHAATNRLVYLQTDPVQLELELEEQNQRTIEFLEHHCAFFTFAENLGRPDCRLPVSDRFKFEPTRQPVVLEFWRGADSAAAHFTTVGNWRQRWRHVHYQGRRYTWSKHLEFKKFIDLPKRTEQTFELALASYTPAARAELEQSGWRVREATEFSSDVDAYRAYITDSRGEFTVAKEQNIEFRSGWFSDRSATYLAAGRPVITQETGFSNILPTGAGLFGFTTMDEILAAVSAINSDYESHRRAAAKIARSYFSHEVVLQRLLEHTGAQLRRSRRRRKRDTAAPARDRRGTTIEGVNFCGYLRSESGVGAAARAYIEPLRAVPLRVSLRDLSDLQTNRSQDATITAPAAPETFPINIVCADVELHYAVLQHLGESLFRDRYNIAIWAWELPNFPERWYDRFAYYDEVWVATSFIANTLATVSPLPVIRIPPTLTLRQPGSREAGRKRLRLEDEFLYLFVFDFNSHFARKNPLGIVEAFRCAFPTNERARLVFKCVNGQLDPLNLKRLQEMADDRIMVYDGYWSAHEMRDLFAACDSYVSLHRSEGTGLTISEAMALGKPVIATGWSGNMDFMNLFNSFPVDFTLTPIEENVGPYTVGQMWAEPNLIHAAKLIRRVFDKRKAAARRGAMARRDIQQHYSVEAVARLIGDRMSAIALRQRYSDFRADVHAKYAQYKALPERIRDVVRQHLPCGQPIVAVVSKGDDALVELPGCEAWHFPRQQDGRYAGYYPRDSAAAIAQLQELRLRGARYLLFPNTSFWWLEHYSQFRSYLEISGRQLPVDDGCCVIYELSPG